MAAVPLASISWSQAECFRYVLAIVLDHAPMVLDHAPEICDAEVLPALIFEYLTVLVSIFGISPPIELSRYPPPQSCESRTFSLQQFNHLVLSCRGVVMGVDGRAHFSNI